SPNSIAARTVSRSASSPRRCPSIRGSPRRAAQRPLPSMITPTCTGAPVRRRRAESVASSATMDDIVMSWPPATCGIVPWRPLSYARQPSAIQHLYQNGPLHRPARQTEPAALACVRRPLIADQDGSHLHDFGFLRAQRGIDLADELIRQFLDLSLVAFLVVLADRLILEQFF